VSDADSLLRERLAAAAAVDVEADPPQVREDVARRQRRRRRRRRGTVVLGVLAVAALAGGAVLLTGDSSGEDPDVRASTAQPDDAASPYFKPASGWQTVQTSAAATAANVPLGPGTQAGTVPWDTVATLQDGDVVLFAMVSPATDVSRANGLFPPAELPLSLDDAQPGGLEGQPDDVYGERLAAEVDGWNIDVVAFFGGGMVAPSAETRAAADRQLARLVVPSRATAGVSRTAAGTCRPSDLQAQVALAESSGALSGTLTVRNVGAAACTLSGAPLVQPVDTSASPLPATTDQADPAWRRTNAAMPAGWPTVQVAPGAEAQAVLRVVNWCGAFDNRLYFVVTLPGHADRIGGAAPSVQAAPLCTGAGEPMAVSVGPFEPPSAAG
jgi:hypothetical protein